MTDFAFDDRKYTERQVRQDDRLVPAALDYVNNYTGDYEFILMARELLRSEGKLSVNTVKGILNCMRGDPEGYRLLPKDGEGRLALERHPEPQEVTRDMFRSKGRRLHVVEAPKEKPRRAYIDDLRQTFHGEYLLSMHRTAQVAHYLDHQKSNLWYITDAFRLSYPRDVKPGDWYFQPVAYCGSKTSDTHRIAKTPWGRRMCPTCVRIREEKDIKVNAMMQPPPPEPDVERCYHCARVIDLGYSGRALIFGYPVCNPNTTTELDCFKLVTVHGEGLGSRRGR
jgi:hypothetical protein